LSTKRVVYRMVPSGAYMVMYKWQGEPARFITLDRPRAEEYAKEHHGTFHVLYIEKAFEAEVPEQEVVNGPASNCD
jgi:hypothetical protein